MTPLKESLHTSLLIMTQKLVEGLFNPRIQFSAEEWELLAECDLDQRTPEGRLMRCLGKAPSIVERAKSIRRGEQRHLELIQETRAQYLIMSNLVKETRNLMDTSEQRLPTAAKYKWSLLQLHAHYQRLYGITLAFAIMMNRLLSGTDKNDACLTEEVDRFSKDVIELAERAACYRPLGASWITLCLWAARTGTENREMRAKLDKALADYACDFPRMEMRFTAKHMESLFHGKHLGSSRLSAMPSNSSPLIEESLDEKQSQ